MAAFLQLSEELGAAHDAAEAFAAFERAVRPYGYVSVDYASGPLRRWSPGSNLDWRIDAYLATFDWTDDYRGTDFQRHDRTLPFAMRQSLPWLYWDLWSRPRDDPVQAEMEAMVQARVRSGLGVPLHGPGLRFAGVHLGSDLPRGELEALDKETRAEVFLLAALFHAHMRTLYAPPSEPSAVSERERECLLWAARGETAWETSAILSISESAVKKHLASAAAKLGARTRTQAVASALARGVIRP